MREPCAYIISTAHHIGRWCGSNAWLDRGDARVDVRPAGWIRAASHRMRQFPVRPAFGTRRRRCRRLVYCGTWGRYDSKFKRPE